MSTQERVHDAQAIFEAADREGAVPLVVLDDDEECVLGSGTWALSDAAAWRAWAALEEPEQDRRGAAAVSRLRRRGLLAADAADDPAGLLPLGAPLGIVATARSRPSFLVTVLADAGGRPLPAPLGYGLVETGRGVRGVVVEIRSENRHDYRLLGPGRVAASLARWAERAVTTDDWGARCETVVVEVVRHAEDRPLEAAAVTVTAPESRQDGMTLFFDGTRERHDSADTAVVAERLERLLRTAVPAGDPPGAQND